MKRIAHCNYCWHLNRVRNSNPISKIRSWWFVFFFDRNLAITCVYIYINLYIHLYIYIKLIAEIEELENFITVVFLDIKESLWEI